MAGTKAALTSFLMAVASPTKSAYQKYYYLNDFVELESNGRHTGESAISALSRLEVLVLRVPRSCLTRADTPPSGRASKAGFFATIVESASPMVGTMALMASTMLWPSDSETGVGTP
jgi:hypothetical protein